MWDTNSGKPVQHWLEHLPRSYHRGPDNPLEKLTPPFWGIRRCWNVLESLDCLEDIGPSTEGRAGNSFVPSRPAALPILKRWTPSSGRVLVRVHPATRPKPPQTSLDRLRLSCTFTPCCQLPWTFRDPSSFNLLTSLLFFTCK